MPQKNSGAPEREFNVTRGPEENWCLAFDGGENTFLRRAFFILSNAQWKLLISALQMTGMNRFLESGEEGYAGINIDTGQPVGFQMPRELREIDSANLWIKTEKNDVEQSNLTTHVGLSKNGVTILIHRNTFIKFRERCLILNAEFKDSI